MILLAANFGFGAVLALQVKLPEWACTAGLLVAGLAIGRETDLPALNIHIATLGVGVVVFLISMKAFALGSVLTGSRVSAVLRVAGAWMLAIFLAFWAVPLYAHETTRSFVALTHARTDIAVSLRVALRDIEAVVWMDKDLDGSVTWAEAKARLPAVSSYLVSVRGLSTGGDCGLIQSGARVSDGGGSDSGGIAYRDIDFRGSCSSATAPQKITSRLFADVDPDHRMYLTVNTSAAQKHCNSKRGGPNLCCDR